MITIIAAMGNVYNAMIDSPKKLAIIRPRDELLRTPFPPAVTSPDASSRAWLCWLCFKKKDTVIGTIGKTHGVSNATKPQIIASIITPHIDLSSLVPAETGDKLPVVDS